jgi:hypothetical protein
VRALHLKEADFESHCPGCDDVIYPGDEIVLLEDDDEWVHRHCAEREGYDVVEG